MPASTPADRPVIDFPLSVSEDGRRVQDRAGQPVLFQGDAAWSLIANTTLAEAEAYFDDRRARGFNTVIVSLVEYLFCADPPRNRAGDDPFTTPGDFTTPNEVYMAHAERVLALARDRRFVVFLDPAYLGYPDAHYPGYGGRSEGWYEEVLANGPEKCAAWGQYLGERFGQFENLIWTIGGDRNPGAATQGLTAIARGLRGRGITNLFTSHVLPECSPLDQSGIDWVDVNLTYTYEVVHRKLRSDWQRRPAVPFLLIESTYENEHNASELQIRRQAYWSVLSGGNGHCMGNAPIWLFGNGWREALGSPGSLAMQRWGDFFRSLPWAELVPDTDDALIVSGQGEERGLDWVGVAATPDREVVVGYLPSPRTIVLSKDAFAGLQASVEWFEPATARLLTEALTLDGGGLALTSPFAADAAFVLRRATSSPRSIDDQ